MDLKKIPKEDLNRFNNLIKDIEIEFEIYNKFIEEMETDENFRKVITYEVSEEEISIKIEEFKESYQILKNLDFNEDQYSENFIDYFNSVIAENEWNHEFLNKDKDLMKSLQKVKSGEITFKEIIKEENRGIGAGGGSETYYYYRLAHTGSDIIHLSDKLYQISRNLRILEFISKISNNIVVIGSNGSGKSTLVRQLKTDNLQGGINIIASQHLLYLPHHSFSVHMDEDLKSNVEQYQQALKILREGEIFEVDEYINDLHNTINYMLINHYSDRGDTHKKIKNVEETKLEKVLRIFNKVLNKEIIIEKGIKIKDDHGNLYNFNQLSDGERQVFYFIANTLAFENTGYIIIDEPENHLNSQISKHLWDTLELEMPRTIFVYITHDPDFAASRKNSSLIWSQSYAYPYDWKFELIEEEGIPDELLVEVLGSKREVLFCEGEYGSIDYDVYSSLFPEYKVLPIKGHNNVISYTKAINELSFLNTKARGIVDSDGKSEEQLEHYRESRIFSLHFNMIEMLLIADEVLDSTMNDLEKFVGFSNGEEKINDFKEAFIKSNEEQKVKIITKILKNRVDYILETEKLRKPISVEDIKSKLEDIVNRINIDDLHEQISSDMEQAINNKEYEKLLRYCNLKDIFHNLVKEHLYGDYQRIAINTINNNSDLRDRLINKYFKDFS